MRSLSLGIVIGVGLILLSRFLLAEGSEGHRAAGVIASHDLLTRFEMSVSVDATLKERPPVKLEEERRHYVVPDFYGQLIEITTQGDGTVLWYEGPDGLRNVILDGTDVNLVTIERRSVKKLRSELIR